MICEEEVRQGVRVTREELGGVYCVYRDRGTLVVTIRNRLILGTQTMTDKTCSCDECLE